MHTLFDYGYTKRDMREERAAESYNLAYAIEDEKRRREWVEEFGDSVPYVTNGREIEKSIARSRGS